MIDRIEARSGCDTLDVPLRAEARGRPAVPGSRFGVQRLQEADWAGGSIVEEQQATRKGSDTTSYGSRSDAKGTDSMY